tara:strand:+ start:1478 stop:1750 length:273 start_codon:yes stop_codon:yes gene_type:complete
MRFERQHDPDPMRHKFQEIDSFEDLPSEIFEQLDMHLAKMKEMTDPEQYGEEALLKFIAFQSYQISCLQAETKQMYKVMELMAEALPDTN